MKRFIKFKKCHKYSIVFFTCMILMMPGLCSTPVVKSVGADCLSVLKGEMTPGQGKAAIEKTLNEQLTYHSFLMDINSIRLNLSGTRIVQKSDTTVVKADSGSLTEVREKVSDQDIKTLVERVSELQKVSENNGAAFLYCAAPSKEYYETNPKNAENHFKENYETFLSEMKRQQVPYMDFTVSLRNHSVADDDIFFYTDHHWKPTSGFVAYESLCEELEKRCGFSYNKTYADIGQYTVKTYPDWYLGSKGKKVGTYFSFAGADDFDLITPNFYTDLTVERPDKHQIRNGEFKDTVLFMERMKKDYYESNPYATYCGGNFYLQIMKNRLNPEGKKILLIRDSFACVVAPFLALQTSELHMCDMRSSLLGEGNKVNAEEYIKQIRPDYVIVLYYGVTSLEQANERYSFF